MTLVIPKRLLNASLRSKLLTKISIQPYHAGILTHLEIEHKNLDGRTNLVSNIHKSYQYVVSKSVRQFSLKPNETIKQDKGNDNTPQKLTLFQRFKQMYKDYWYVLVPVHLVTSAAWLGGFYYLASSGVDIPALLESMNFSEKIINSMRNSSMGYVAVTYGLYKIATPARYALTVGGTTISINYLKKYGYIKPMPSKERLKEIYKETKGNIKDKSDNLKERVHNLQQTVKETKEGIKEKKDSIVSSVRESKSSIKSIKQKVISSTAHKHQNKP